MRLVQQSTPLPPTLGIPESDWQRTPTSVQDEFLALLNRVDALEARLNRDCRSGVQDVCASVFSIPLSKGAIQKMINRVSQALVPHHDAIGRVARAAPVNHLDETSWFTQGVRHWLWVMTNPFVTYFQIHRTRSQAAFEQLIADWRGILVSDDYGVYQSWTGLRQTCLAHLIRTAKGLAEHLESGIAAFGRKIRDELQRLCYMATERPTVGHWRAWYARFRHLISSTTMRLDKAGTFARRLDREQQALWLFLDIPGIGPTNNASEVRSVDQKPNVTFGGLVLG